VAVDPATNGRRLAEALLPTSRSSRPLAEAAPRMSRPPPHAAPPAGHHAPLPSSLRRQRRPSPPPSPEPRSCAAPMGLAAASSRRRRGGRSKGGRPASARSNSGRPASARSKGGWRRGTSRGRRRGLELGLDLGHESSSGSIRLGRDPIPVPALPPHRRLCSLLPSSPSYPAPSPPRRSGLLRRHGDLPHVLQPHCPHQAPRRLPRSPVTARAPVPTANGLDRCVHILARGGSAPRGSGTGARCHGRRRG